MSKYNGVYIPPGVVKGSPARAASDNIDTPDGTMSTHLMDATHFVKQHCLYINGWHMTLPIELFMSHLRLLTIAWTWLKMFPQQFYQKEPCTVIGNPKRSKSSHCEHHRLEHHSEEVASYGLCLATCNVQDKRTILKLLLQMKTWRVYNGLIILCFNYACVIGMLPSWSHTHLQYRKNPNGHNHCQCGGHVTLI